MAKVLNLRWLLGVSRPCNSTKNGLSFFMDSHCRIGTDRKDHRSPLAGISNWYIHVQNYYHILRFAIRLLSAQKHDELHVS